MPPPTSASTGSSAPSPPGRCSYFVFRAPSKPADDPNIAEARRLVATWADKLDRQTTPTGVYVRWPNDTLPEADPWGRELAVEYSQGGVAEHVTVRSLGPDGVARTPDDVVAVRHAVNLKGIGEGVKKNAEETRKNVAKGAVKGIVEGAKEAVGKGK
ncbi:MAG: hypothetical protein KF873_07560 [Gemmataceae bacterium]|nr:hypothetical protein [Gemmataceae bacterium]